MRDGGFLLRVEICIACCTASGECKYVYIGAAVPALMKPPLPKNAAPFVGGGFSPAQDPWSIHGIARD